MMRSIQNLGIRFLNRHLPPNIYHIHSPQGSCKYCVISLDHLEKEVGPKTKDVYHLGRFSKRMGIVWARNPEIENRIANIQKTAIISVSKKVLQSLNENFMLEDFIRRSLYLSYQGDVQAIDKVDKIMLAEKVDDEVVFQHALEELGLKKNELGFYTLSKKRSRQKTNMILNFLRFIRKSRTRARLRWPKNMFTVEQWLDYILAKIERTQGDPKFRCPQLEKKFWFIFGWKYFFRLSRKKLIK